MLIGLVTATVIAASAQTTTPTSSWVIAAVNADGSRVVLLDLGRMRREPSGVRTAWAMTVYSQRNDYGADYVVTRKQYRCSSGESRFNYLATYRLGDLSPMDSGPYDGSWIPALPGSAGEGEQDTACSNEILPGFTESNDRIAQIARDLLNSR